MSGMAYVLLIQDSSGAQYAVPMAALEAFRVPQEMQESAIALLARTAPDEVHGHSMGSFIPMAHVFSLPSAGLEAQDKLGNFQIQSLMSNYNEAQTLASSVLKKKDDAGNAVIGKI